jgi:hypothetical protein
VPRSSDRPLDAETRSFIEPRLGHDFSRIPLYAKPSEQIQTNRSNNLTRDKYEQEADQKPVQPQGTRSVGAGTHAPPNSSNWPTALRAELEQAFQLSLRSVPLTVDPGLSAHGAAAAADGVGIRVDPMWLNPESKSGQHLIAHELAHLTQQPHRDPGPSTAEKDADATADRFVRGQRPSLGPTVLEPRRHAIRFKTAVEAAKDAIRLASWGWFHTDEEAILKALRNLTPAELAELSEDPSILRLLEDELSDKDLADVGAELARGRVGGMSRPELAAIAADPGKHSIGVIAAAKGRDVLLEHQERVAATGTRTIQGPRCSSPVPGVGSVDCTTYILGVLREAFAAKKHSLTWDKVMDTARKASPPGKLEGTEVLEALQSEAGWEAVFWSPDPRNPADRTPEHPAAYKQVRTTGKYSPAGVNIPVDPSKSVINYRRTDPAAKRDISGIERLQRLQFGVLATRGGIHMGLIINGSVYEVHWDKPASDPTAIEATPLETWAWQSGVIVAPKGDLERAWNTP